MKRFKLLFIVISVFSVLFCCILPCFAVSYHTYSDVLQNNSTVNNLLSLRSARQKDLHYIAFRSSSDEYMLVLSDKFTESGKTISSDSVYIISYNPEYGSSNSTRYFSTTQNNFSVTVNHVVVSDFLDFSSKNDTSNWQQYILIVCCLILAFVIFNVLRRFK